MSHLGDKGRQEAALRLQKSENEVKKNNSKKW
jgi:hypothetical protein